jgi:hypothetical protein
MEPQPGAPQPNYDFIMNPDKPAKAPLIGGGKGDPFIFKLLFIIGGTVIVMIVLALLVNVVFGSKTNVESFVTLTESEQEIVRISGQSREAIDQNVLNAAINTKLTVKSHQQKWLAFLKLHRREVKPEELNLKKDTTTDTRLKNAVQTSTFDATYSSIMRTQLTAYAKSLRTTYNGTTDKLQRELLSKHYDDVQLLLKQWPEAATTP